MENIRKTEFKVDKIFPDRWSPRAMSGGIISKDEIMSFFEAARWAPSSYNNQPWRFIYALKETDHWDTLFNLLGDFNKSWCKNAGALVVIISKKIFDYNGKPSLTHSFDTGAAWMNFSLQGSLNGLVVHGMQGFDYEKAKKILDVPDDYSVEAMAAVGRVGKIEDLPKELQEKEVMSDRKKVSEFSFQGKFRHL